MPNAQYESLDAARLHDTLTAERLAYKEALEVPVAKIAGYVLETVGQKISAVALGLSDARAVRDWQEGKPIREENEFRLRVLYRVAKTIVSIYDEATARAWLRSSSPYLGDAAPAMVIAAGEDARVVEAMRSFLEG